jgi:hypothetical protein
MNVKRYILASILVFAAYVALNFVIHGLVLGSVYMEMQGVWRQDMMGYMWITYATAFVFSFLFVLVFHKGYEGRGILEGVRFGILIGLLLNVLGMFNQFAVYPLPFGLIIQWFIYGVIQVAICGIVAAAVYRKG